MLLLKLFGDNFREYCSLSMGMNHQDLGLKKIVEVKRRTNYNVWFWFSGLFRSWSVSITSPASVFNNAHPFFSPEASHLISTWHLLIIANRILSLQQHSPLLLLERRPLWFQPFRRHEDCHQRILGLNRRRTIFPRNRYRKSICERGYPKKLPFTHISLEPSLSSFK